ncbi:MAG: hypothetical protein WC878_08435 [Candidatus Paceibacterota bacterium]|jgi:hypothetical protein
MKKIGTLLLLVGFAGMAVFGLFVMDFAMGHDDMGCIASRVSGNESVCPMNLLQMAFHHISAFQAFTQSTVSQLFGIAFLFFLLLVLVPFVFFKKLLFPPKIWGRAFWDWLNHSCFQQQKITRWLALFEHSPSII